MRENMITVLKIEPGNPPELATIRNELECFQAEVGGYIECVSFPNRGVLICNEEGKMDGLQPNRWLSMDIICGTFLVCGRAQDGNFCLLTKSEVAEYSKLFSDIPTFTGQESELEVNTFGIKFE